MPPKTTKKARTAVALPEDDDALVRLPTVLAVFPIGETTWHTGVAMVVSLAVSGSGHARAGGALEIFARSCARSPRTSTPRDANAPRADHSLARVGDRRARTRQRPDKLHLLRTSGTEKGTVDAYCHSNLSGLDTPI